MIYFKNFRYTIFRPALAYPAIVEATSRPAVTVAENTINKRVCAVTGMLSPVVMPLLIVPRAIIPVKEGANVTKAPGTAVKLLSGVGALNSWAVMVIVEPTKVTAAVVLK